jgi:DNA repair protein RecO (recombination protein O)
MAIRGTVIHVTAFDESSRVIEVLTAEEGKLALVARGARASKKRFAGGLDLFTTLELDVVPTRHLWRLDSSRLIAARVGIRASLDAFERAGRLTECARWLTNAHQPSPDQARALGDGLDACDRGALAEAVLAYPRLLAAAGILPDLAIFDRLAADQQNAIADKAEHAALDLVEAHLGYPLKTRATHVT